MVARGPTRTILLPRRMTTLSGMSPGFVAEVVGVDDGPANESQHGLVRGSAGSVQENARKMTAKKTLLMLDILCRRPSVATMVHHIPLVSQS